MNCNKQTNNNNKKKHTHTDTDSNTTTTRVTYGGCAALPALMRFLTIHTSNINRKKKKGSNIVEEKKKRMEKIEATAK